MCFLKQTAPALSWLDSLLFFFSSSSYLLLIVLLAWRSHIGFALGFLTVTLPHLSRTSCVGFLLFRKKTTNKHTLTLFSSEICIINNEYNSNSNRSNDNNNSNNNIIMIILIIIFVIPFIQKTEKCLMIVIMFSLLLHFPSFSSN